MRSNTIFLLETSFALQRLIIATSELVKKTHLFHICTKRRAKHSRTLAHDFPISKLLIKRSHERMDSFKCCTLNEPDRKSLFQSG